MDDEKKVGYSRVSGTIIATTRKALLLKSEHNDEEAWIPKSVCGKMSARELDGFEKGDSITLFVADWLVKQKGLQDDGNWGSSTTRQ